MAATRKEESEKNIATERRTSSTGRTDKKTSKVMGIILTGLLAISLLWAVVATFTDFGRTMHPNTTQKTTTTVKKVERSVTGKSVEEDQKAALNAAAKILNLSGKSPTGATVSARLQSLAKGDVNVMDKTLPGEIQFSSGATAQYKATTYQTLLTLYTVLSERAKNTVLKPAQGADSYKAVAVDQRLGSAYVPLNVFTTGGAAFSLEMVYVDGVWRLAPYTLVDAIQFSAAIANSSNASTSTASPSASSSK